MAAASAVFAERGIIGASVEEICETAGFTRGAFYSNFASKDELVLALLQHELESQYTAAQAAIASVTASAGAGGDPATLIATALEVFESAGRMDREWILTQQELLLHAARQPEVRESYLQFSEAYVEQFGSLIWEGLHAARIEFTIPFEDAVALLTSCHQQDHVDALLHGRPNDVSRLRMLLNAITRPASSTSPARPGVDE